MESLICENCGMPLNQSDVKDGVIVCRACGNSYIMPSTSLDQAKSGLLAAERELKAGKFNEAYIAFSQVAQLDPGEPEAYFGMALATFRIQYLRDEIANCLRPICFGGTDHLFSEDQNVKKAVALSRSAQKEEYLRRIKEIDYLFSKIKEYEKKGVDYDCFLSVKVTEVDSKKHTEDYVIAERIYKALTKKGYHPFFSEEELEDQVGADYEAVIYYALMKAKCMLLVCTNRDYLQTPWVKNEYTRYLQFIKRGDKKEGSISIFFDGTPIEELPGEDHKIQGINGSSFNPIDQVCSFIDSYAKKETRKAPTQISDEFVVEGGKLIAYKGISPEVNLPDSITVIGEKAFKGNTAIKKVVFPKGLTTIEGSAFYGCSGLTELEFPETLSKIGKYTFANCSGISKLKLTTHVSEVGEFAFYSCTSLTTLYLSKTPVHFGINAFGKCEICDVYFDGNKKKWLENKIDFPKAKIHCKLF